MENKSIALWFLGIFMFVVVILCICFDCGGKSSQGLNKPNYDTIYQAETKDNNILKMTLEYAKKLELKNDSLMLLKPKYIIRYKTKFDSLYFTDTVCQNSLITLYNSFGDLNNLNDSIIANNLKRLKTDSITMATLFDKVKLKQDHIYLDSVYIVKLCDSIPKVRRKAFRKGLFKGIVAGAVIVESVNLASKIKP